jgi:hypothetical protein
LVTPTALAEIVAVDFELTFVVLTTKVIEVFPAGIVTVAGTVAPLSLLARVTTKPPVGAAAEIFTVPVEVLPPVTVVGLSVSDASAGGLTVSVAVSAAPLRLAVIVALV